MKNMSPTLLLSFVLITLNILVGSEACSWCPGGKRSPSGVSPTSNGCGSGWQGALLNPLFTSRTITCCNSHDICYGSCSKTKAMCDAEFSNCLKNICNSYPKEGICVRGIMSWFVEKMGCSAYQNGQARSCRCK